MVFQLRSGLVDFVIIKMKSSILEVCFNWQVRFEINRGLFVTEFNHTWIKLLLGGLKFKFRVDIEVNTWSLSNWVCPVFDEIIFKVVNEAIVLAVRSAEVFEFWLRFLWI